MCDMCGRHVTIVKGVTRCALCGHRVGFHPKLRLRDIPKELFHRHVARERFWNDPKLVGGVFYY